MNKKLKNRLNEIEKRITAIENPAKFELGDKIKTFGEFGEKIVHEYTIIGMEFVSIEGSFDIYFHWVYDLIDDSYKKYMSKEDDLILVKRRAK